VKFESIGLVVYEEMSFKVKIYGRKAITKAHHVTFRKMMYVPLLNAVRMKILILKLMVILAFILFFNLNIKGFKETALEMLNM
jgi:hypothetical protein